MEYLDEMKKVVAVGSVVATYRDSKLVCDEATIYMETKDAYLKGHVELIQPGGLLRGEELLYNFETRKGTLLLAEAESGPWRSKSDQGQKVAATAFTQQRGYLTGCDFEEPHTRLKAREVQIFLDDKVVLKNVVMMVGKVPLFYLPSYTHPLDDKRARVTIIPGKDKQWGLFLLTSWRLYLMENLQGQIHVDYRERLDLASGLDLRYELPVGGEGLFRSYYTNERDLQRKRLWSGLLNPDKDKPTQEKERFRVQLRHAWDVDRATRAILEYNALKDSAFLKDFFLRENQRDISPATYLQITHSPSWYGLSLLVNKRVNKFETITQQWPSITFDLRPFRLPWLPT
ncbi:MAG: LPS-assembly protein LptD, partial [Candidatus Omnitrophica bacterium]|nr:LPS-assembly protein LptD [Candidatus Omnitrophota bacterium]